MSDKTCAPGRGVASRFAPVSRARQSPFVRAVSSALAGDTGEQTKRLRQKRVHTVMAYEGFDVSTRSRGRRLAAHPAPVAQGATFPATDNLADKMADEKPQHITGLHEHQQLQAEDQTAEQRLSLKEEHDKDGKDDSQGCQCKGPGTKYRTGKGRHCENQKCGARHSDVTSAHDPLPGAMSRRTPIRIKKNTCVSSIVMRFFAKYSVKTGMGKIYGSPGDQ
ncbi:hypothetical protein ACSV9I_08740 [Rhizobium sp. G187]|uniref:hypothetical protein n=1 Tax=Rhizobium sp. G187 TaxID=3451352 RepID=UPI003EE4F1A7